MQLQTLRYLITGLPYDVWWALVDRQINAIFLAINAVVGAIVTIAFAVMFFGLSIPTVLISLYVVWVRLNYIERIFFSPQADRELKGVYGGKLLKRLKTYNKRAFSRLARMRRRG